MGTTSVAVAGVSKRFRLYDEKHTSLKERLINIGKVNYKEFWALRDVSFEIEAGETVGILGRNGSGKSTLLKCISGILQPTEGAISVTGQLAALLELGAGFQPELSGRENIFLNASLLGLSTKEVERRFDEIVAFAELEEFIDNQVKFYSSGMYVRLGFAVAVNVEPDVLVVDEVLAVGDERFQRKCLGRIKEFQRDGRTILFVTHAADLVRQICDRAVVLGEGQLLGQGTPGEAIRLFRDHLLQHGYDEDASLVAQVNKAVVERPPRPPLQVTAVHVEHPGTGRRDHMLPGEPLTVRVAFEAAEARPDVVFWVALLSPNGDTMFATDTQMLEVPFAAQVGPGEVVFSFPEIPFLDGSYQVLVGMRSGDGMVVYDERDARFTMLNPGRALGTVALECRAQVGQPAPA